MVTVLCDRAFAYICNDPRRQTTGNSRMRRPELRAATIKKIFSEQGNKMAGFG
jgi:hypothetical protein